MVEGASSTTLGRRLVPTLLLGAPRPMGPMGANVGQLSGSQSAARMNLTVDPAVPNPVRPPEQQKLAWTPAKPPLHPALQPTLQPALQPARQPALQPALHPQARAPQPSRTLATAATAETDVSTAATDGRIAGIVGSIPGSTATDCETGDKTIEETGEGDLVACHGSNGKHPVSQLGTKIRE
mmetsp:Transcript_79772/g.131962  ORF Transcript_79772/g.131962 Transcript_79772/m.131962 type:complete len:182 (+) Transcript_79772:1040-1585(+)